MQLTELSDRETMMILLSGAWQADFFKNLDPRLRHFVFNQWRSKQAPSFPEAELDDLWEAVGEVWNRLGTAMSFDAIKLMKEMFKK